MPEDDHVVSPRQLSQQCRDFLVASVCLVELAHPKEVRPRVAAHSRVAAGNRGREFVHDAGAPLGALYLPAEVGAELPVQVHQLCVDGFVGAMRAASMSASTSANRASTSTASKCFRRLGTISARRFAVAGVRLVSAETFFVPPSPVSCAAV